MSTDTDEIKNQLENNAELIDLLSSLKELGCRFPGQTVKLSLISIAEDNIKKAASLLDEILAHVEHPPCVVELDKQSTKELILLAEVINKLTFPAGSTLIVVDQQMLTHGMARVSAFFKSLNNPSISGYSFANNNLTANDENAFFEILETLSKKQCRYIDLSNNKLNVFTKENLFSGLKLLASCNAQEINLGNNSLCSFGLDFILSLKDAVQNGTFVRLFSTSVTSMFSGKPLDFLGIEAFASSLAPSQKLQFAEAYYHSVLRYKAVRSRNDIFRGDFDITHNFGLADEQILLVLEDIVSKNAILEVHGHFSDYNIVDKFSNNLPLSPKNLVLIIKKAIALGLIPDYSLRGGLSRSSKLELIHKLELFLCACQYDNEVFFELDGFNLFLSKDPAIQVLETWKNVCLAEQVEMPKVESKDDEPVVVSNALPMLSFNNNEMEDDVEIRAARVRKYTLPRLKHLCEVYFPEFAIEQKSVGEHDASKALFMQPTIERLRTYKEDEEGALPFLNMAAWFSWTCSRILMEPRLAQLYNEELKVKPIINKVLKEILNFASPKLRYALSDFFFDQVCLEDEKRYFSLVENCTVDALLPALTLCQILFQEKNPSKQEKCVEEIKTLLKTVSFSAYYGRYFRSLVSAILALSEDTTIEPFSRLQLINKILAKPSDKDSKAASEEQFLKAVTAALECFKLSPKEGVALKKLETEKQTLERKIGKLKHTNISDPEIQKSATALAATNEKIQAVYNESNKTFQQTKFDEFCNDRKNKFESKFLEKIKAYIPKGRLSNQDFHALQRRVEGDLKLFYKGDLKLFHDKKAKDFNQCASHLIMIQGLARLHKLTGFVGLEQHNFTFQARSVLKEIFSLSDEQAASYDAVFSKCHNEAALLTYLSKIRTVTGEGADKLMHLFNDFVRLVLSKNSSEFYNQRYNRTDNQHLTTVFSGRDTLKAMWRTGESCDLKTFIKDHNLTYKPYKPNFREFLDKKIFRHKHLDTSFYDFLKQYLDAADDFGRQKALEAAEQLMSQSKMNSTNTTMAESKKQHAIVQYECIQLLKASKIESESYAESLKILDKIKKALQFLNNTANQFKHDIDGMIKGLRGSRRTPDAQDWTGWKIIDTDHFWSLFMAGTDVEGSCQAVDGDPSLNKCLMAYVMDGKNRMLAIQNAEGVTVVRCIFRLLWDANESPVLFLEEIYPETIRRDLYEALVRFAIIRAEKLNATLVTLEGTDDSCQHEGEVTALGNAFVSWEYVDARYSAEANGEFTIPKSQELFRTVLKDDLAFQGSNVETKDDLVFHLAELQKALSPRDLSPDAPLNREKGNIPRPLTPILNSMNVVENSSHFGVTQGPNTREYLCTRGSAEP